MSKSTPSPPDYKGAAEAQAASSREVTEQQTYANRPDQYTPWGSFTWDNKRVYDPATGQNLNKWTQNVTLEPGLQDALDSQIDLQANRSDLANRMYSRAEQEYSNPMNWGDLTDWADRPEANENVRRRAEDALYNRATSRLDPQWEQREDQTRARLIAQGLRMGDDSYDTAMENLGRERTDAYDRATQQAIIGGGDEMKKLFGMEMDAANLQNKQRQAELVEAMQRRGWSLNEINALISGQQVGMPQQPEFSNASRSQPTQYLSAADRQYNAELDAYSAEQAGWNSVLGGLSSIPFAFG